MHPNRSYIFSHMLTMSRKGLLILVFLSSVVALCVARQPHDADIDDNEFAEFEEFEDEEEEAVIEEEPIVEKKVQPRDIAGEEVEEEDDEVVVETEDDEFEHLQDEEEFEGFDKERGSTKGKSQDKLPDLEMAKVPLHLRTNWDSFYLEMLMIAGLGVYFLNFLAGKTKNGKLAQCWLGSHREILESNFAIVGDDGSAKEVTSGILMKDSENVYALWCSGRTCVEGMLVELKLLKRQDLINCLLRLFKPASDQVVVTVDMEKAIMDKFVFCIAHKKVATKLHKDMQDLSQFTERKNVDRYDLPASYQVLSEVGEATSAILDKKVCQVLTKFEGLVDFMHFSDQYSGPKNQDESQPTKMPTTKSVLIFSFNVPGRGKTKTSDMEVIRPLLQLVFYCMDKIGRLQLSREAKNKSEKNRQKAEEVFLKQAHAQRQEAAQARREEKKRAEKERLLSEEDPDKARKLEERESRREMKRKQPKMKMMKMKAM
ncbi:PAT complex subunit CCDC47-like isoform X1 [Haliotis rufescens]|uniref:PAT complex subunit CCDC47-like isoform X1 n=2 Tax=Haliotis TaxID=6452 RepID=UPI001EB05FE4|nr:PAT complex subunit CCDC47-like isoform X1 [Haliotis rufescens]